MSFNRISICLAAMLLSTTVWANTTFAPKYYPRQLAAPLQVDLNGDGIPDFIDEGGVALISTGGGNYRTQFYNSATFGTAVPLAAGDFNGDGKADVLFYNFTGGSHLFFIAYGDGRGGFSSTQSTPNLPGVTTGVQSFILGQTADFNGDGKPDVALAYGRQDSNNNVVSMDVRLYVNNGHGFTDDGIVFTFALPNGSVGVEGDPTPPLDLLLGDFDSDGHADLGLRILRATADNPTSPLTSLHVLYGDGHGHFTPTTVFSDRQSLITFAAADINDDGHTDIVGADYDHFVHIFQSLPGRAFREDLHSTNAVDLNYPPALGDFDGNGLKDTGFVRQGPNSSIQDAGLGVLYQSPRGSFFNSSYTSVDVSNAQNTGDRDFLYRTFIGDYNHDGKPDVVLLPSAVKNHPNSTDFLFNTGLHAVGACPAPKIGVNVCSPGTTSASPVHFSFSATSFYPVRKMEVWVDGVKRSETYHVFSNEGFADVNISLPRGTHRVSFLASGFDSTFQKKTVTLTVP